jgi:mono/diheme cytochrome c family protein
MIQEPVAIAWDGDGRMYVAEMITYMQDADATGENEPLSRIMRLEDTNGDGIMDKSTVFIDSLVLPRMILPLGKDRIVINDTYSYNLWSYSDTNGDGIADKKRLMYHNDKRDNRNLEHQRGGLIWNIDNWIYLSRDPVRYRYAGDRLVADTFAQDPNGQRGLAKDEYGRLFFSLAGGEVPALSFQQNPVYGRLNLPGQRADSFDLVWPVTGTPDVQGGIRRVRSDSTLNHFTASCGQSVFVGDRLPHNLYGNLFICEPVGRLIRRAIVMDEDGKIVLKNAYHDAEFLASTDMNFRPVNTATGPDGCLYIVDMYHGIIQEHVWTPKNSYIRPRIMRMGLEKNIGRGRIYRLVHDGYKPGPRPHMLEMSNDELVSCLDHPGGWWRDEAQKLLVLHGDKSVVPALKKMALGKQSFWDKLAFWNRKPSALARIHALWTLEGLDAIDENTLYGAFKDEDPQVRKAAVWISEAYIKQNDGAMLGELRPLMKDSSADVRFQLSLSLRDGQSPEAREMLAKLIADNTGNKVLTASWKQFETDKRARSLENKIAAMNEADKKLIRKGAVIFQQLCSTCHGVDGRGIASGGNSMIAPPLAAQARVNADKDVLIKILLNGLSGPIDGKNYPDVMPAQGSNNDLWIASVLSYIRNDMDNHAAVITPDEVKKIRGKAGDRKTAWTLQELER